MTLREAVIRALESCTYCQEEKSGSTVRCSAPAHQWLKDALNGPDSEILPNIRGKFEKLGQDIGAMVDQKDAAYGNSFHESHKILVVLYPSGIMPDQYPDMLAITRIVDKLKRIATDRDALGESPYRDIAGYGLLGANRVEQERAAKKIPRVVPGPPDPPVPKNHKPVG